jgi:hypothetical protein
MSRPRTWSVAAVETLGRTRLSQSFFMRDFLFSDIAAVNGFLNMPDDPELAVAAGTRLCEELLEPLQRQFGRVAIRSAYRSAEVNAFGNAHGLSCASNEANRAAHIWDMRDAEGRMGATACVVLPAFWDRFQAPGDWQKLAWWIHDHLPYSSLYFFPRMWAVNINWREDPLRRIDSYAAPKGCLTRRGMPSHDGSHRAEWEELVSVF